MSGKIRESPLVGAGGLVRKMRFAKLCLLLVPVLITALMAVRAGGGPGLRADFRIKPARPEVGAIMSFDASSSSCDAKPCSYRWTAEVLGPRPGKRTRRDVALTTPAGRSLRSRVLGRRGNLTYAFSSPGTYSFRLTVLDHAGRRASKSMIVAVVAPPGRCGRSRPAAGDLVLPDDPHFVGPCYWARFKNGPSSTMDYFPICTYQTNLFQNPSVVPPRMKRAGINCVDMAYDGGVQNDLSIAADYGMWENVMGGPSKLMTFTANRSDVKGYAMLDAPEEENDQYNPSYNMRCTPTHDSCAQAYVNTVGSYHSTDPTRPVWGNFSTGVEAYALPPSGWTSGEWQTHMEKMVRALDVVSGDSYFWTSAWEYTQKGASDGNFGTDHEGAWGYGRVQDRIRLLSSYKIPTFNIVECCDSLGGNGRSKPANVMTPEMIRTGVWDALVHGARGIDWWTTNFWDSSSGGDPYDKPYTDANGDPVTYYGDQAVYADHQWDLQYAAMKRVDGEIERYTVELNSPTVLGASALDDDGAIPVSTLAKDVGGKLWLVAMADGNATHPMSNQSPMSVTITVPEAVPAGTVLTVVGENRTVTVNSNHRFTDTFGTTTDGPDRLYCGCSLTYGYQHHIYSMR